MSAADGRFVSLAEVLRTPLAATAIAPKPAAGIEPLVETSPGQLVEASLERLAETPLDPLAESARQPLSEASLECIAPDLARAVPTESSSAVRAARIFRAALGDAFDALLVELVRRCSADILARELHLSPADVAAIARRLIAERFADEPVRIRVAPAEAAIDCGLPVVADPTLAPGDVMLECRTGTIDARLGVRLAQLLAELSA